VARYLTARALFLGGHLGRCRRTLNTLSGEVSGCCPMGCSSTKSRSSQRRPLSMTGKTRCFWSAIIGGEDSAIDMDPAEQEQVRAIRPRRGWDSAGYARRKIEPPRHMMAAVGAALGRRYPEGGACDLVGRAGSANIRADEALAAGVSHVCAANRRCRTGWSDRVAARWKVPHLVISRGERLMGHRSSTLKAVRFH